MARRERLTFTSPAKPAQCSLQSPKRSCQSSARSTRLELEYQRYPTSSTEPSPTTSSPGSASTHPTSECNDEAEQGFLRVRGAEDNVILRDVSGLSDARGRRPRCRPIARIVRCYIFGRGSGRGTGGSLAAVCKLRFVNAIEPDGPCASRALSRNVFPAVESLTVRTQADRAVPPAGTRRLVLDADDAGHFALVHAADILCLNPLRGRPARVTAALSTARGIALGLPALAEILSRDCTTRWERCRAMAWLPPGNAAEADEPGAFDFVMNVLRDHAREHEEVLAEEERVWDLEPHPDPHDCDDPNCGRFSSPVSDLQDDTRFLPNLDYVAVAAPLDQYEEQLSLVSDEGFSSSAWGTEFEHSSAAWAVMAAKGQALDEFLRMKVDEA
ncbi:hypothetical protein JCM8097_007284 [Rhodosporidiobolus ruineniae]